VGRGIMILLRLGQSISSGCDNANPKPKFFLGFVIIAGRGIMLLLRLSQVISSGRLHANPTFFRICHYCGKGAFCFFFDLATVFLQVANTPPLHPFFPELSLLWEWGIMFLLRLSQIISSVCHNATHTPFFGIVIIVGRGIMLRLRLSLGISSVCHHATPTPFFRNCHYCEKGHYSSAST